MDIKNENSKKGDQKSNLIAFCLIIVENRLLFLTE